MHSFDPKHHNDAARGELLTLLALGEPIDQQHDAHIQDCVDCQNELAALRRTVTRARYLGIDEDQSLLAPSPAVWQNIVAELDLDTQGAADDLAPRRRDRRSWRSWAGAAAAVIVIAVAAALCSPPPIASSCSTKLLASRPIPRAPYRYRICFRPSARHD